MNLGPSFIIAERNLSVRYMDPKTMKIQTDSNTDVVSSKESNKDVVSGKDVYKVSFNSRYPIVILRFFGDIPEAKKISELTQTKMFVDNLKKLLIPDPHLDKLVQLIDQEFNRIIDALPRETDKQVIAKIIEITDKAKKELERLGYEILPGIDYITTKHKITDRDLFDVNKVLDATYGMILQRK